MRPDPRAAWASFRAGFGIHHLCYASGLLMILAGSTGSAVSYLALTGPLESTPVLGPVLQGLRHLLIFFATLGGTSVLIGGYLAEKRANTFLCSVFISLGSGLGLLGIATDLVALLPNPAGLVPYALSLSRGLGGLGAVLGVAAQLRLLFPWQLPGQPPRRGRERLRAWERHWAEPAEPPVSPRGRAGAPRSPPGAR